MENQSPTPQLKTVPKIAPKSKIFTMYNQLSSELVRQVIRAAIIHVNKNSSVQSSLRIRILNEKHILFIVNELGTAPGYYKINQKAHE
ncbi:hypothetical protein [Cochleicola gelatinilyticus]|uniref:Uncharacterized protein n=1 Tax=Cochleicola gelatinilyticus TaxID=1763537 RepID=A0A167IK76_9FLAO|nr:hypothetical protein [Cochleicola gelatinilyticus]OAB79739.1 hypothetical protein ULVI_03060 [Cochleicola gelatinilyticus]